MPRDIPRTTRIEFYNSETARSYILLITLTPDGGDTYYLSSDPTQRLSLEPLIYGTIYNDIEWRYAVMSAILPDDEEDKPPQVSLAFENITYALVEAVRSSTMTARVDFLVIEKENPEIVLCEYTNLRVVDAGYNETSVTVNITREPLVNEPWPAGRMTKPEFPGLHK